MNDYYRITLEEIRSLTKSNPMLVKDLENYIENLEARLENQVEAHAQTLQQIIEVKDSRIKEQQAVIENTRKTLELYETENKALRELLRLWI